MTINWKKALRAVLMSVFVLIFMGGPLLFVFLMASLGMTPLYVTKVIPVAGIAFLIAMILAVSDYLTPKGMKWVWRGFGLVCLGCVYYAGWGFYNAGIPTVDDRTLMLHEYEPFTEGTKAVSLDEPAALRLDEAAVKDLRLDGATALYPVYAAFVQAVYPQGEYPQYGKYGDGSVMCTNTVNAYERLIEGDADLIFVAGPSQTQLEMAHEAGVQFHLTPIGREAFVFFVNSKNPVDGLSVEQIQGIYSGKITNWKEVGGKNQAIRPFQRAENSGSQTALQKLMGELPLMEPEEEDRIAGMGGIIRQVASYRNYKNALGFSFRFYASEMEANDQIKLLALNGVVPTRESILDGSYPIASEFYAVTAAPIGQPAPQEQDETLANFLEWILSEQGQEIIERTGYVSLK